MKKLISLNEAAKILRISRITFLKKINDGTIKIPYSHIGRVYKFWEEDVENYFNNSFKQPEESKDKDKEEIEE